jgi:hypothetical protein
MIELKAESCWHVLNSRGVSSRIDVPLAILRWRGGVSPIRLLLWLGVRFEEKVRERISFKLVAIQRLFKN